MSWNNPKKKRGNTQAAPVVDPRFPRCDRCSAGDPGYGEQRVGTLLITETVRLAPDEVRMPSGKMERPPAVDIGTVIRCPNEAAHKTYHNTTEQKRMRVCERPPVFKPGPAFAMLGIEHANVYRLLRACTGQPTFYLDELKSGKMRQQQISESMAEKMRPLFNEAPEAPEAPAPVSTYAPEMF